MGIRWAGDGEEKGQIPHPLKVEGAAPRESQKRRQDSGADRFVEFGANGQNRLALKAEI